MKPRHIEAFKAIVECGSISKAALTLNISQPAVTATLQLLERDVGLKLFSRTSSGMTPTAEGRALYTEVQRIFTGLSYLQTYARDLRSMKHGRIAVAVIPAMSEFWLPEVASHFLNDHPEVSLFFQTTSSPNTAQWVVERRIDFGIAQSGFVDNQIERQKLFTIDCVCIMPTGHPLTSKEIIHPEDLADQTFVALSPGDVIRIQTDRILEQAGVQVKRQVEVALGVTVRGLVGRGFGIAIVDSQSAHSAAGSGLVARPFQPSIAMEIFLLRPRGLPHSQFEEKFIDYCIQHAPKQMFPDFA